MVFFFITTSGFSQSTFLNFWLLWAAVRSLIGCSLCWRTALHWLSLVVTTKYRLGVIIIVSEAFEFEAL